MHETELGEDERRLTTLISQPPAVIYSYRVSDGTPVTTYVSESVTEVLGFEPDYFVNAPEHFEENLHPDDAQGLFEEEKLLTDEDTDRITVEYRFKDKQGTYHWLHDEQQVSINEEGEQEVFGAWWDISERKEAEEKLKKRNQQLDNFASIVSHDLRNPLTVAQGRLEMALEECNCDHLAPINRSLERMESLIDDLLTLAQEGKTVAETSPVELQQSVAECWTTVATADGCGVCC